MSNRLSTENLATSCAAHPKRVFGIWFGILALAFVLVASYSSNTLTTEFAFFSNPDSKKGTTLLTDRLRGVEAVNEVVIVRSSSLTVDDAEYEEFVSEIHTRVVGIGDDVGSVADYYSTGNEQFVSENRHTTILPVVLAKGFKEAEKNIDQVVDIIDEVDGTNGFEVFLTGEATFSKDFADGNQKDAERGEMLGIPIALLILAVVFGAIAAALLPIALAMISIIVALGIVLLIGQAMQLQVFATNLITMIGLAVGIDYSLFIVSRFREERRRGLTKNEAIRKSGSTAGRAVLYSGMTVALAVLALLLVPHRVYFSIGLGMVTVLFVAVAASLTLLPALLSVMGDKVDKFKLPFIGRKESDPDENTGGFWNGVTNIVMRNPGVSLVVTAGILIALTVPYFDINTGTSGIVDLPDDFQAKQGFEVLQEEFGFGLNAPVEIVIEGDIDSQSTQTAIEALITRLAGDPDFGEGTVTTNTAGNLALLSVPLKVGPSTEEAIASVRVLRDDYIPNTFSGSAADVYVTGLTAEEVDFVDIGRKFFPIVLTIVLSLSFIFLTMVFRSLVIATKAIIMNLLSVGAAYGILVLVWQKGVGNEVFGFPQVDVIQAWMPIMLFAILFGLSMDYQVFLISRIKERYQRKHNNDESVAYGLRSTAGLITGAALIMVAIFSGFAAGDIIPAAQFGFGMAVAILLDATVVRSILVPASMKLLGDSNWYLPGFLQWLPRLDVEGESTQGDN